MPSPSHNAARTALTNSLTEIKTFTPQVLSAAHQRAIGTILLGDHKTFRYILITALLAKVVEPDIHMRSLQQGANLDGAYDARSLCHDVWVRFEREHLDNRLGGSNEPYLNKPARFPAVEKTNAVRAGNDRLLLSTMYDLLEELNDAGGTQHKEAFLFAMGLIMSRSGSTEGDIKLTPMLFSVVALQNFTDRYLAQSFGGEVPVSVASALLQVRLAETHEVRVHPANQAGTSSNEVGDIDVYEGKTVILPVEVKDKSFSKSDVDHACNKAKASGCPRLLFVRGRSGSASDATESDLIKGQASHGFDLSFIEIDKMLAAEARIFSGTQRQAFVQAISKSLTTMRCKDEAKRFFEACLKDAGFTA